VTDEKQRLIQFKTNIDVVMSVLEKNGLGDWLADRLVSIGDGVRDDKKTNFKSGDNPFLDERLRVASLPTIRLEIAAHNRLSGSDKKVGRDLVPARRQGGRRTPRDFGNHQVDETMSPTTASSPWRPICRNPSMSSMAACGSL